MFILFFIVFLMMGGASISETCAVSWEDESEIPFSKLEISPSVRLKKLLTSAPKEINGKEFMAEYQRYSAAQKGVSTLINKIFLEILEQDKKTSSPMAITQTNVIWTGDPMSQHYLLRLLHMAEEKGRKVIVWGDSENPPTHWEHRHDGEAIKELRGFLQKKDNKERLGVILKVKRQQNQEGALALEFFEKVNSIFEKVDELIQKTGDALAQTTRNELKQILGTHGLAELLSPESLNLRTGFDDSQKDFARSFLTQVFFSSTLGSVSPFPKKGTRQNYLAIELY
ncbi:MAG: hypothetical protein ACRCYZ_05590 [Alphaproteobacteria bacterium]